MRRGRIGCHVAKRLPASNKDMKVPGMSLFEYPDVKITRVAEYWDMATVTRQLAAP